MSARTEVRCQAGQRTEPVGCERHGEHYRCEACDGWFGVPHDYGCHTKDPGGLCPGNTPPRLTTGSDRCACTYCREYAKAATRTKNELTRTATARGYAAAQAAAEPWRRSLIDHPETGDLVRSPDTYEIGVVATVGESKVTIQYRLGTQTVARTSRYWSGRGVEHARPWKATT